MAIDTQNSTQAIPAADISTAACVPPAPGTVWQRGCHLFFHIQGFFLLFYLKLRHRRFVRDARPLALHLERRLFPMLRGGKRDTLTLYVHEATGSRLTGVSGGSEFGFPGTERLTNHLRSIGVRTVHLDTDLEYGQIVEAFLILLYVSDSLDAGPVSDTHYTGWRRDSVAAAIKSPQGYHKFCAKLGYDHSSRAYNVEYSYCELFFSRAIRNYVEGRSRFHDHRALFFAAPRVALLMGFALLAPGVALTYSSPLAVALWAIFSIVAAVSVGLCINALGAMIYAQEHRSALIDDYLHQIGILSRFPEANPNPTVRLGPEGNALYVNPAGRALLDELAGEGTTVAEILPAGYKRLVQECLDDPTRPRETEVTRHGRVFHYVFSPFPDERSVIAQGTDVTYLKKIEDELRDLNQNLEKKVAQRTAELRQTQDVTIISLAGLAEIRDPETGEHLERTRSYVRALAEQLRGHPRFKDVLDDASIEHLYKSTPLHDVGKIGVRDAILLKPGPLSKEEYEEMKRHTILGGDALRWAEERLGFDSFLGVAREIAYYHHERWDGRGYPYGLSGDAIPWAARLMSLADFYDALTSERVYKQAFPHEETRQAVLRERGKKFDPDVVDAFIQIEQEFIAIASQFNGEQS